MGLYQKLLMVRLPRALGADPMRKLGKALLTGTIAGAVVVDDVLMLSIGDNRRSN